MLNVYHSKKKEAVSKRITDLGHQVIYDWNLMTNRRRLKQTEEILWMITDIVLSETADIPPPPLTRMDYSNLPLQKQDTPGVRPPYSWYPFTAGYTLPLFDFHNNS